MEKHVLVGKETKQQYIKPQGLGEVLQDGDYVLQVAGILSESCSIFALLLTTSH